MNYKKISWLLCSTIVILALAGCQTTTAIAPAPTVQQQQSAPTQGTYPNPGSSPQTVQNATSYPAPAENTAATQASYPAPQPGPITWDQAIQLISTGNVSSIVQTSSLSVTLTMKTGEVYTTTASAADSAQQAITACGNPCKDLTVTTK